MIRVQITCYRRSRVKAHVFLFSLKKTRKQEALHLTTCLNDQKEEPEGEEKEGERKGERKGEEREEEKGERERERKLFI